MIFGVTSFYLKELKTYNIKEGSLAVRIHIRAIDVSDREKEDLYY